MTKVQTLTVLGALVVAFLAELAAHLLLKYYMPNPAFGGLGFLLVGLLFYYVLFVRRDVFGFILIVYISSHFSYADNQGGLWNLMTFGILALYLFIGQRQEGFRQHDYVMNILLGILILSNVLGWTLKNPMPIIPELQGVAAFFGFILIFRMTSNIVITQERFRLFLAVTFFMLLYQFAVAVNQHYGVVSWNTPLLGDYTEQGSALIHREVSTSGTLRHYELFGEYAALMTCLLVPLLSSSVIQREIKFGNNRIVAMIFICLAFVPLTRSRAATILVILTIVFYYIVLPMRFFSAIDRVGRQLKLILGIAILVPLLGAYIGLHSLEEKFATLSGEQFTVEGIISGKDINRGKLVSMGLDRLDKGSWWIGYGYGIPRSNRWAWFGADPGIYDIGLADFHSLYLSLPEIYGWVGALAFLAMIVVTAFRALSVSLRYRNRKSFLIVLAVGFTVFWGVFLADEYKISILRNPNYQMLFWIWLGLTNSIVKTIRYEKQEKTAPVSPPSRTINRSIKQGVPV